MIKKNKLIILFFFVVQMFWAQQDPQFTHYMYNTTNINPAYAGSREVVSVFGLHRTQWVGLDGAPTTNAFSLHSPVGEKIGLGLSFLNDNIGPADENTISIDISYSINFENSKLAFGLKPSLNLLNVDYTKLSIYDLTDPQFQSNINNELSPNIGAGIYWYSTQYYVGFSIPNFLETKHYSDIQSNALKERQHYFLMAGYVFDLSPSIEFKPAFLSKIVSGAPLQLDATANFLINQKLTLGIAYRWDAAISGLVGFQLTDKLFLGYSYDADTTQLANFNSGSHEIFLRFEIFNSWEKIYCPRFF
jgi:type IX secretion system PorP/SprF family membrane protein